MQAQLARSHGYLAEAHTARTEDGHLLAVFRVRNASATAEQADPAEPVLLVPGLACNAAIWVLLGPGKALGRLTLYNWTSPMLATLAGL